MFEGEKESKNIIAVGHNSSLGVGETQKLGVLSAVG